MPEESTRAQHKIIAEALIQLGHGTRDARLAELGRRARRPVPAFADLTHEEAADVLLGLAADLGRQVQAKTRDDLRAEGWAI